MQIICTCNITKNSSCKIYSNRFISAIDESMTGTTTSDKSKPWYNDNNDYIQTSKSIRTCISPPDAIW